MKKLILILSMLIMTNVHAQFKFPGGGRFPDLCVDTKVSFGIQYSSTTARVHIKGQGATSATSPLYIEDASSNMHLQLYDDGQFLIRTGTNLRYLFAGSTLQFLTDGAVIRNQTFTAATITWDYARHTSSNSSLVPSATTSAYWL